MKSFKYNFIQIPGDMVGQRRNDEQENLFKYNLAEYTPYLDVVD